MERKQARKSKSANIFRQVLLAFADVVFIFFAVFLLFAVYIYLETPVAASLFKRNISLTSIIYDRTGTHVLYEIHGEEDRKLVSHEKIPDTARIATIAAEDKYFFDHYGIDPISIMRAIFMDVKNNEIQQGGSTITQQLARNAFLTREKTFKRKFLEAILAVKIEKKFNKNQILDMYFNQIPYGSNAYGIEAAAQTFFGKNANSLTLDEAALLAALPKATSYYSPYSNHKKELILRQKNILSRIAELGFADNETINEIKKINTLEKVIPFRENIDAPHFTLFAIDELEKKYGKKKLEESGLRIYTTLDYNLQELAEDVVQNQAPQFLKSYGASNAALVALNPKNGEILAMVGSTDFFNSDNDGQVNVTLRPRQPGSSFKPIVYATAFEKGYQPETLILDAQTNFGPDGSGRDYIPRNYDGRSHGVLSMRQTLAMSLNIPAVKTLRAVGLDDVIEMAHRLGITTLNNRQRYGLSLAIGGGEVKLLDETAAFSVFANDGKKNIPTPILKIADYKEKIYESNQPQNAPVLDSQIARKINSILSDNSARIPVFGPNNKLFIPGKIVAAKTGTTQDNRDAWIIGYTPNLATGVWTGNNDNHPMSYGADGSFVAAPIWNKFMSEALKNYSDEQFIAYDKKPANNLKNSIRVTYYKKKNGKQISKEKAGKMDSDKVETKIESVFENPADAKFIFTDISDGENKLILKDWNNILKSANQN